MLKSASLALHPLVSNYVRFLDDPVDLAPDEFNWEEDDEADLDWETSDPDDVDLDQVDDDLDWWVEDETDDAPSSEDWQPDAEEDEND